MISLEQVPGEVWALVPPITKERLSRIGDLKVVKEGNKISFFKGNLLMYVVKEVIA